MLNKKEQKIYNAIEKILGAWPIIRGVVETGWKEMEFRSLNEIWDFIEEKKYAFHKMTNKDIEKAMVSELYLQITHFKNTTEEDIHDFIYIFMTEVFDCFFHETEKSDYQIADLIYRVVKAIREGNDEFYEEVITKCEDTRKKLGGNFQLKGDDSDDEDQWDEENDEQADDTPLVKTDIEQFKKKKKKEKVQIDIDEEYLNKMKNMKDDDDEDWNPA